MSCVFHESVLFSSKIDAFRIPQICFHIVGHTIAMGVFRSCSDHPFLDGLAAGCTLSVANYILLGFAFPVDGFYEHSFEIWLACTVVFPGAGNVGYTLLEYRIGHRSLISSLIENLTWVPFL